MILILLSILPFLCCRSTATSVRPLSALSPSPLSFSSARLRLSVFCHHFHPCQTPRIFSVALVYVLFSGPPATIISPSLQHLFLPSILTTSTIFYPYTPTHHRRELPGNYLTLKKYGNLPLCLENYALFSFPPIFTNILYTYTLRDIIYLGEPIG